MKLNSIRLLVNDFDTSFKFYAQTLGLKVNWGKEGGEYASFEFGIEGGLGIYKSDLMAQFVGNDTLKLPENTREKMLIGIQVKNVDATYEELLKKDVEFVNQPIDMGGWGMRVCHFRDPEGNLLEIWSPLDKRKWDKDLLDEDQQYNG